MKNNNKKKKNYLKGIFDAFFYVHNKHFYIKVNFIIKKKKRNTGIF